MDEPLLHPDSAALLAAARDLRRVVRRVWSASSVSEILAHVTEAAAQSFKDADMVGVFGRVQEGCWHYPVVLERAGLNKAISGLHERLRDGLTPEQIDESMLFNALPNAGDVGTWRELLRDAVVRNHLSSSLEAEGFKNADTLISRIESSGCVDATLFVSPLRRPKIFSQLERTLLGTLADIASLATRSSHGT